jgi:acyl-CoA synthetase (AMP-forming)/AMP-acid ligase II
MNLVDAVLANADRRPDWPALEQDGTVLTYRGLHDAVDHQARRLRAAGIGSGDLVGLAMRDTVAYVVTMLAMFRTGAVMLPVDVRWTAAEKGHVLAFFGAAALLVDEAVPGLDGIRQLDAGSLPDPVTGPLDWPHDPDSPLLLSLSSGTTGTPKGPRLSSRQFQARLMAEWIGLGFLSSDRFLCATPLYFGGGRGFTLSHLIGGATVVLHPPPYDAAGLPRVIEREQITSLFLVPTILRRLASGHEAQHADLSRLRLLISSGSALHPEERVRVMSTLTPGFYNLYASTEGGSVSVLTPDAPDSAAGSVGRSAVMSKFEIVDDDGALVPSGTVGHIRQRAPWLPQEFWNNPTESAKVFRDGAYYPGDMGFMDADGFLHITGRSKDMIIRGGVNIYPNEIERVLLVHPAVQEAAIVAWPSAEFGEEVAAFVTLASAADPDALRQHCRASLASYKVPAAVFVVDDIPKNSAGKVQKAVLAQGLTPR